jgi:hypothetical protein
MYILYSHIIEELRTISGKNKHKDKKKKNPITKVRLILYLKTTGENLELCPLYWLKLNALAFKWRKWGGYVV